MPHQCTTCDRLFGDGSKEMLSGCPNCGGNKFQFLPSGAVDEDALTAPTESTSTPSEPAGSMEFGTASESGAGNSTPATAADGRSTSAEESSTSDQSIIDADARNPDPEGDLSPEDIAQADARSTVVSDRELQTANERTTGNESREQSPEEPADDDTPDLAALREELNQQFESIKILEPGQYELNLMELYDREEYIVALEEDGRYAIKVPDSWRDDE